MLDALAPYAKAVVAFLAPGILVPYAKAVVAFLAPGTPARCPTTSGGSCNSPSAPPQTPPSDHNPKGS